MDDFKVSERELELLKEYQRICDYIYQIQKKSMETYRLAHKGEGAFVYGCVLLSETEEDVSDNKVQPEISAEEETGMIWPPFLAAMDTESADDRLKIIFSLGLSGNQAKRFFSEMDDFERSVNKRNLILRYYIENEIFDRERINEMLLLFREKSIG